MDFGCVYFFMGINRFVILIVEIGLFFFVLWVIFGFLK